jgi:hypothetical protein
MVLEVVEQLATAARHLEQATAGVEVLPVGPKMLGQMVDSGCQESDLHLARTGVLIVDFVLGYDFWLNDCRHFVCSCVA